MQSRAVLRLLVPPLAMLAGCFRSTAEIERENIQLREELAACRQQSEAQETMIADLHEQLATARGLTEADRAAIIAPVKLVLGRLTGPEDFDGRPGDDGVTAYFQLQDELGDPIKVAGDVTIELFDLTGAEPRRISRCAFPAAEVREMWTSTLLTYMYMIRCPFEQQPEAREITVRVTFLDYLTRRSLTGQTSVAVRGNREQGTGNRTEASKPATATD